MTPPGACGGRVIQRRSVNIASQGWHGLVRDLTGHTLSFDLLAQRNDPPGRDYRLLRVVVRKSPNAAQVHGAAARKAKIIGLNGPWSTPASTWHAIAAATTLSESTPAAMARRAVVEYIAW
jgi:hypothetical protein